MPGRNACMAAALAFLTGCATMANNNQQVSIDSKPDHADVMIGKMTGVTPMAAGVPGGWGIPRYITISKDGWQGQTMAVARGFRTSDLILDILPGLLLGPFPLLIDLMTGDFYYVSNTSYYARLLPAK